MLKRGIIICCVFLTASCLFANDLPFKSGEELKFDIHYKYGLIMMKAGTANYRLERNNYNGENSYKSVLDFKTTSFFDSFFKVRDTISSHISENIEPFYHLRIINEGKTFFKEEVIFKKSDSSFSEARIRRENKTALRFDTILTVNNLAYDILNIFVFARTLDYKHLKIGQNFKLSTFIGKEKVNIVVHFDGQSIIDKSETLKYKAYKLSIDITDEVFSSPKSAMEAWISDDDNHIPLKLKAKLKIGAAEADLVMYKNLKYPFSSEIKIPVR
ncbi:MAG: DUF3108 domain-containing protein [Candidatus Symbiothrix sp.]|jgi:hypothetical protein|nr:DUF3108 domain-containing protein [Candidatus Symbiothrix sp.]